MSGKVSICHITVGHNPLDDRIFYKELRSLSQKYSSVYLVAPDRQEVEQSDGVRFVLFREKGFLRNLISAYRKAKQIHADLYHVHEFELLPFALILRYKYRRKVIYDAHETIFYFFTEFSRRSILFAFFPALFAQALEWLCSHFVDHIITVTPWIAQGFRPFHKKVSLVYNYPNLEFFSGVKRELAPQNKPIILYHGQIVQARNIDVIVESVLYVKEKFPSVKLLIVGSVVDWYYEYLQNIVKRDNLEEVVEFRDRVPFDKIPQLIAGATIGLSSMSPNESFKRSIQIKPFEFMSMGVPVLGCRVPSTEIYIEKPGAGVLVDPPTPGNLGRAIIDLLDNPEKMKTMGEKGRKAVSERYNWKRTEPTLLKVYEEVLGC